MYKENFEGTTQYCNHETSNTSGICDFCLGKWDKKEEQIKITYESGKEERIPYPSQNLVEEDRFKIDKTPETEKDIQQSKDFYNIHSDSPVCPAHKGSLSEDWKKEPCFFERVIEKMKERLDLVDKEEESDCCGASLIQLDGKLYCRACRSEMKTTQEPMEWEIEWENSDVSKRITATEMFAIRHGFEEWNKPTVTDFIKFQIKQAEERVRKDTIERVKEKVKDEIRYETESSLENVLIFIEKL